MHSMCSSQPGGDQSRSKGYASSWGRIISFSDDELRNDNLLHRIVVAFEWRPSSIWEPQPQLTLVGSRDWVWTGLALTPNALPLREARIRHSANPARMLPLHLALGMVHPRSAQALSTKAGETYLELVSLLWASCVQSKSPAFLSSQRSHPCHFLSL